MKSSLKTVVNCAKSFCNVVRCGCFPSPGNVSAEMDDLINPEVEPCAKAQAVLQAECWLSYMSDPEALGFFYRTFVENVDEKNILNNLREWAWQCDRLDLFEEAKSDLIGAISSKDCSEVEKITTDIFGLDQSDDLQRVIDHSVEYVEVDRPIVCKPF